MSRAKPKLNPEIKTLVEAYYEYRGIESELRKSEILMQITSKTSISQDAATEQFRLLVEQKIITPVAVENDVTHYRLCQAAAAPTADKAASAILTNIIRGKCATTTVAEPVQSPDPVSQGVPAGIDTVTYTRFKSFDREFESIEDAIEYSLAPDCEILRYMEECKIDRRHRGLVACHVRRFLSWRRKAEAGVRDGTTAV